MYDNLNPETTQSHKELELRQLLHHTMMHRKVSHSLHTYILMLGIQQDVRVFIPFTLCLQTKCKQYCF